MQQFYADRVTKVCNVLAWHQHNLSPQKALSDSDISHPGFRASMQDSLEKMKVEFRAMDLPLCLHQVTRIEFSLSMIGATYYGSPMPVTVEMLAKQFEELGFRLTDSLKGRSMLALSDVEAAQYESGELAFGDMSSSFSSIIYDVSEAAKCRALGRSTACAFHSIRCLEAGIRALSRCLGVPDPTKASDRSWAKLLNCLKAAMEAKWPNNSHRMHGDGQFFDNAYAALAGMQNPWRNATMHLDQKYTQDEADHIFEVVRGFMKKIASRMDEEGMPAA
jgi:hypothetical protein